MFNDKIRELKSKLTKSQFKLAINMFNEDIEFHKPYRNLTEHQQCEILGQAATIAQRF